MRILLSIPLLILALAASAAAQTKISGTLQCAKPNPTQIIQVGDAPGHAVAVSQSKCTWPKPITMEGIQSKDDINTTSDEIHGTNSRGFGYDVGTLANGDKFYVRFGGIGKLKDGAPESLQGKWNFTGGTGKLKGVKGQGTYKGKGNPDGTVTFEIEGDYSVTK